MDDFERVYVFFNGFHGFFVGILRKIMETDHFSDTHLLARRGHVRKITKITQITDNQRRARARAHHYPVAVAAAGAATSGLLGN